MRGDRGMRFVHGKITDTVMGTLHLATCVCVRGQGRWWWGGGLRAQHSDSRPPTEDSGAQALSEGTMRLLGGKCQRAINARCHSRGRYGDFGITKWGKETDRAWTTLPLVITKHQR